MSRPGGKLGRLVRRVVRWGLSIVGLLLLGPLTVLILVAETRQGRLVGAIAIAGLAAGICLAVVLWRVPERPQSWWIAAGSLALIAVGLALVLVRIQPAGATERASGLVSRFVGERRVPEFSPFGLLPEIDQVKLILTLATRPLFWSSRARLIRETTLGHYRAIAADPSAQGLGPVTHFAALELIGLDFNADHYFVYIPATRPGERLGAIVFLHGNGGNFQAMPWAWRALAKEQRLAIICPTFGFGFWDEGGIEAVDRVWADAQTRWPIDPERVYLAGLSDGGVGVTRSGRAHPERYRGLIYISPTMNLAELGSPKFVDGWKGRPVLVFQGDRDRNVPKAMVDPAIELLLHQGVTVDYRVFEGEDHFLFFSKPRELFGVTVEWMDNIHSRPGSEMKAGER